MTVSTPDDTASPVAAEDTCHHCGATVKPFHTITEVPYPARYWFRCCGLPWWNEG